MFLDIFKESEQEDEYSELFKSEQCYDDPETAVHRLIFENSESFHEIMDSVICEELSELINGEVINEESKVSNIVNSIIEWIKAAWKKVEGVIHKFIVSMDAWITGDKAFLKSYRGLVLRSNTKFTYEGYIYNTNRLEEGICNKIASEFSAIGTHLSMISSIENATGSFNDEARSKIKRQAIERAKEIFSDEVMDGIRGRVIGESAITKKEFSSKLKIYFAGSEKKQKILYDSRMNEKIIHEIESAKDSKKAAKETYTETKKAFKILISVAENMKKDIDKSNNKAEFAAISSVVSSWNKMCKQAIDACHVSLGVQIAAIRGAHNQARALAAKIVSVNNKKVIVL